MGDFFFKNHVRCSYLHANFDNKHVNNILFIFSCLVDDLGFGGLLGSMEF